jgi:hypothetical protein
MIWRAFLHQQDGSISSAKLHRSRSNTMNGYQSSAKPFSEREIDLQRVSDFHAVLLGMAAHDLRQPLQVIQSTYEWLSGRFDAEADRMRLQRGERAVARLAEQLDRLAAALRLYQHTTMMELSPVPPKLHDKIEGTKVRRGAVSQWRNALLEIQNGKCFYDESHEISPSEVDHVLPWSFVLEDKTWNLVLACRKCNNAKRDRLTEVSALELLCGRNEKILRGITKADSAFCRHFAEWHSRNLSSYVRGLYDQAVSDGFPNWK